MSDEDFVTVKRPDENGNRNVWINGDQRGVITGNNRIGYVYRDGDRLVHNDTIFSVKRAISIRMWRVK